LVNENIILFSGYARLPQGTAASEMYKVMALVILVDIRTGIIVDADCTLSVPISEQFVKKTLVGGNLRDNLEDLVQRLNKTYQGAAKKAIITALRVIADKYNVFLAQDFSSQR
jgi:c-di-AMP phosphodiesterase-like protein